MKYYLYGAFAALLLMIGACAGGLYVVAREDTLSAAQTPSVERTPVAPYLTIREVGGCQYVVLIEDGKIKSMVHHGACNNPIHHR